MTERRGTGSGQEKEAVDRRKRGCFTDSATCEEARKDEEKGEENNSRYTGGIAGKKRNLVAAVASAAREI